MNHNEINSDPSKLYQLRMPFNGFSILCGSLLMYLCVTAAELCGKPRTLASPLGEVPGAHTGRRGPSRSARAAACQLPPKRGQKNLPFFACRKGKGQEVLCSTYGWFFGFVRLRAIDLCSRRAERKRWSLEEECIKIDSEAQRCFSRAAFV